MIDKALTYLAAFALIGTVLFFSVGGALVYTDANAPIIPASEPAPTYSVGDTLVIERHEIREIKPIHDNNQNRFK